MKVKFYGEEFPFTPAKVDEAFIEGCLTLDSEGEAKMEDITQFRRRGGLVS